MESFTRDGLTFDVSDDGPADGRLVVALHGFPEDRHCWSALAPALTAAGYRVLAPDQRGYSPRARPAGRRRYVVAELAADVLALADAAGADRFDVIGHDWGAAVAWELAGRHPARVRTLTSLSVPHPRALRDAVFGSSQLLHSWYMVMFQLPWLPEQAMRRSGPGPAAARLARDGLDAGSARRYAECMSDPARITGPLNWYRAIPFATGPPLGPVQVPTLFLWGEGDRYVTRYAAERSGRYVTGRYRFEPLAGESHWLPTAAPGRIGPPILEHLAGVAA